MKIDPAFKKNTAILEYIHLINWELPIETPSLPTAELVWTLKLANFPENAFENIKLKD